MNPLGAVAAVTAFAAIWVGHVTVRKVEYGVARLWIPTAIFLIAGVLLEWMALITPSMAPATVFGIIGITFLWNAFELRRQERRVRKGHAPANPENPRHAEILNQPGSPATTVDVLKRQPAAVQRQNGTRTNSEERVRP